MQHCTFIYIFNCVFSVTSRVTARRAADLFVPHWTLLYLRDNSSVDAQLGTFLERKLSAPPSPAAVPPKFASVLFKYASLTLRMESNSSGGSGGSMPGHGWGEQLLQVQCEAARCLLATVEGLALPAVGGAKGGPHSLGVVAGMLRQACSSGRHLSGAVRAEDIGGGGSGPGPDTDRGSTSVSSAVAAAPRPRPRAAVGRNGVGMVDQVMHQLAKISRFSLMMLLSTRELVAEGGADTSPTCILVVPPSDVAVVNVSVARVWRLLFHASPLWC